jgi:hypothetical protein
MVEGHADCDLIEKKIMHKYDGVASSLLLSLHQLITSLISPWIKVHVMEFPYIDRHLSIVGANCQVTYRRMDGRNSDGQAIGELGCVRLIRQLPTKLRKDQLRQTVHLFFAFLRARHAYSRENVTRLIITSSVWHTSSISCSVNRLKNGRAIVRWLTDSATGKSPGW